MNAQEFFELTGKVRAAQKLYFRSRLQGDLVEAKGLESQLDKAPKEGLDPIVTTTASAREQRQLMLHLEDERDAGEIEREMENDDEQN